MTAVKRKLLIARYVASGMLLGVAICATLAELMGFADAPVVASILGGGVAALAIKALHLV